MEIKPFKAFRFDAGVVGDMGSYIAPPYDCLSPAQQLSGWLDDEIG